MKKILLPTLLLLSMLSLAACGMVPSNNNNNNADGSISNPWWTTDNDVERDANGNIVYEGIEIDLTTVVAGNDETVFRSLIDKFNEEYDGQIRVIVTKQVEEVFETTVSSQIATNNNAPDLLMSHQKGHQNFVYNQLIQPMDEAIESGALKLIPFLSFRNCRRSNLASGYFTT